MRCPAVGTHMVRSYPWIRCNADSPFRNFSSGNISDPEFVSGKMIMRGGQTPPGHVSRQFHACNCESSKSLTVQPAPLALGRMDLSCNPGLRPPAGFETKEPAIAEACNRIPGKSCGPNARTEDASNEIKSAMATLLDDGPIPP